MGRVSTSSLTAYPYLSHSEGLMSVRFPFLQRNTSLPVLRCVNLAAAALGNDLSRLATLLVPELLRLRPRVLRRSPLELRAAEERFAERLRAGGEELQRPAAGEEPGVRVDVLPAPEEVRLLLLGFRVEVRRRRLRVSRGPLPATGELLLSGEERGAADDDLQLLLEDLATIAAQECFCTVAQAITISKQSQ
mmetsp:Transcript_101373/g.194389  ORF Transcript_101373/g.194389 Transcript_101373/m.194389 type:complete len:192 (-) Transcript_101373:65-640(-)